MLQQRRHLDCIGSLRLDLQIALQVNGRSRAIRVSYQREGQRLVCQRGFWIERGGSCQVLDCLVHAIGTNEDCANVVLHGGIVGLHRYRLLEVPGCAIQIADFRQRNP